MAPPLLANSQLTSTVPLSQTDDRTIPHALPTVNGRYQPSEGHRHPRSGCPCRIEADRRTFRTIDERAILISQVTLQLGNDLRGSSLLLDIQPADSGIVEPHSDTSGQISKHPLSSVAAVTRLFLAKDWKSFLGDSWKPPHQYR